MEQAILNNSIGKPYRVFRGTYKIVGVAGNLITPFENELGTFTISRIATGIYEINNVNLLTTKTFVNNTPMANVDIGGTVNLDTLNDKITIRHYNTTNTALQDPNDEDYFGFIEIIVYN